MYQMCPRQIAQIVLPPREIITEGIPPYSQHHRMGHRGSIRYIILGFDIEVMLVFVNPNETTRCVWSMLVKVLWPKQEML